MVLADAGWAGELTMERPKVGSWMRWKGGTARAMHVEEREGAGGRPRSARLRRGQRALPLAPLQRPARASQTEFD